jgi:hypothetical protein
MRQTITTIQDIGKRGYCSEEELRQFLPDYPTVHGSELIFKIAHHPSPEYLTSDIPSLVKGLHYIEIKHRENNSFGFGSTSPAWHIIRKLYREPIPSNFKDLKEWIAFNGGNYYIPPKKDNQNK